MSETSELTQGEMNGNESASAAELADRLPVAQYAALSAIVSGNSFRRAAEAAGVSRATIYRWVQTDPLFRAAFNAWQKEIKESSHARLVKMSEQAVDVVEKALQRNDERVAVTLLREMGVMRRSPGGLTDPGLVKMQMDLRHQQREYRLTKASLRYLLTKAGYSKADQRQILLNPRPFLAQKPHTALPQDDMRRGETIDASDPASVQTVKVVDENEVENVSIHVNETNDTK